MAESEAAELLVVHRHELERACLSVHEVSVVGAGRSTAGPRGASRLASMRRPAVRVVRVVKVARMTDVLIYADTFRSAELRHEVPVGIPDPFLYAEKGGVKHIAIGSMEIPRLAELNLFDLHPAEDYGSDELRRAGGLSHSEIMNPSRSV